MSLMTGEQVSDEDGSEHATVSRSRSQKMISSVRQEIGITRTLSGNLRMSLDARYQLEHIHADPLF